MLYKHPLVLYLNITVCVILLFLALPALLNRWEDIKVRVSFFLIFFTVIFTCIKNIQILHLENEKRVAEVFMTIFVPLSFGPLIYYYVKNLLGSTVSRWHYLSFIPGFIAFCYGCYLLFAEPATQQQVFKQVLHGGHLFFEITNLLILLITLFYCAMAWRFTSKVKPLESDTLYLHKQLKKQWAREFLSYIFLSVLVFLIIVVVAKNFFGMIDTELDLIVMPVFMLVLYLLISVRSMTMYKDFEYQFVVAKLENEKNMQAQRLELAADLHDSLGAQLTLMNAVLDDTKGSMQNLDERLQTKLTALTGFSENAVGELKNALWVLNSDSITIGDLRLKILNFYTQAAEAKESILFQTDFDVDDNVELSSRQAVNLYRVVQEITNNAIKHAHPTAISLSMQLQDNWLQLKITDDGKGFQPEAGNRKSYGLTNIENRVREIKGQVILYSTPGSGTSYSIELFL